MITLISQATLKQEKYMLFVSDIILTLGLTQGVLCSALS